MIDVGSQQRFACPNVRMFMAGEIAIDEPIDYDVSG